MKSLYLEKNVEYKKEETHLGFPLSLVVDRGIEPLCQD